MEMGGRETHFIGGITQNQYTKVKAAFRAWLKRERLKGRIDSIKHEVAEHGNDWQKEDGGLAYRRRVEDGGRAGLIGDVDNYRRVFAGKIEDAFERHSPGTLDPNGREARIEASVNGASPTLTDPGSVVKPPKSTKLFLGWPVAGHAEVGLPCIAHVNRMFKLHARHRDARLALRGLLAYDRVTGLARIADHLSGVTYVFVVVAAEAAL